MLRPSSAVGGGSGGRNLAKNETMEDEFTYAVIGKAMEVHRQVGPGVDEAYYHELLSIRMREAGIHHLVRPREVLVHRGIVADQFEADLIAPERAVIELKCLRSVFNGEHYTQIMSYMKLWRIGVGLLFDFAKESLVYRRVIYSPVPMPELPPSDLLKDWPSSLTARDHNLATAVCKAIVGLGHAYGLGYRDTTYRGLLAAELIGEGFSCVSFPTAPLYCNERLLGEVRCDCVAVEKLCAVRVLALREGITPADRAILQTHLRLLGFRWGLIVNFGKRNLEARWVTI